ncbi:MAG: branched chain amino acid aminotransferase [Dehalococcoidia bacterium]|nr:MAG: branched chain amino acid aminotransferase [Dehalococcoidia bacterium]
MRPHAFLNGQFVALEDAKVSVATHALHYGTGCFEGIRGNWNAEEETIYLFRLREHYQRLLRSAKVLNITLPYSVDDLCAITVELVERSGCREDVYIRPMAYKGTPVLGVRLHDLDDALVIFVSPFGNYLDVDAGIKVCVSSWRRIDDNTIPARAKVTGGYVNSALARTEAHLNGYDEAIMLNHDGHVSEGSGENIFLVRDGVLHTPGINENILEGITRHSVMKLAADELGIRTIERTVDRSELYVADEIFLTGTAAHVTPVVEVDRRPVGNGEIGAITRQISKLYFDVVRGVNKKYIDWCTPVRSAPVAAGR